MLDQLLVTLAVAFFRGDGHVQLVAGSFAHQSLFQAGNNVACAVQVGQGLATLDRGIDGLAGVVSERVVDGHYGVF